MSESKDLITIKDLCVHYPIRSGFFNRITDYVYAVDGVNFTIKAGQSYGIIGESGSGKSTIGKTIVGLEKATHGQIIYDGYDVTKRKNRKKHKYNKDVQMIFQDSLSSLNPRKKILDIIAEPIRNFEDFTEDQVKDRVAELLNIVGLEEEAMYKFPHQFSGGQRQRIGIARALAVEPKFIIADEPVSALDVSIQAQILNILMDLKDEFHFSYLFIAHDLSVVKHISDSLGVMYLGTIVERAPKKLLFSNPVHPYTKALFSAAPTIDEGSIAESQELRGEIPSPIHLPSGCPFHDRCPVACPDCAREKPELKEVEPGHFAACHLL